jgi:hypothetical protein
MHLVEPANGTFTEQQLRRLTAYRAAVAAGFYTDWDGSPWSRTSVAGGYDSEDQLPPDTTATSGESAR